MQPIWGFVVFLVICSFAGLIASKRGNSGIGYFLLSAIFGIALTFVVVMVTGGDSTESAVGGFIGALVGVLFAAVKKMDAEKAGAGEKSSAHKKCPFCAEPIKAEAIKCKHCGSDLSVTRS